MTEIKWTSAQKAAIEAETGNILVTAAAGSGKTQVLTERIWRALESGTDITRLLVVTFTEAAAAEMRERIIKRILSGLEKDPSNAHLRRQISLMGASHISTMHAFCLDLIKNNITEAGITPSFRTADPTEAELLKAEAMDGAIEIMLENDDGRFSEFVELYGGKAADVADEAIGIYNFAESMPHPTQWIKRCAEVYSTENFGTSVFAKTIENKVLEVLDYLIEIAENEADECRADAEIILYSEYFEGVARRLMQIKSNEWDALFSGISNAEFENLPRQKGVDEEKKKRIKKAMDTIKKGVSELARLMMGDEREGAETMQKTRPFVEVITELLIVFDGEFRRLKEKHSCIDFSDYEHIALNLLTDGESGEPSALADAVAKSYKEIFIDEYQDTNDVQETIFNAVSRERFGEPNIFRVGDVKQSIYAFRNTSPELFVRKSNTYSQQKGEKNRKIALSENFRSRAGVLEYINGVFENIMTMQTSGIEYLQEQLKPGAEYPETGTPDVEINIIDENIDEEDESERVKSDEAEAVLIGQRIKEIVEQGEVYDLKTGESRRAQYSDIVIIMRAISGKAEKYTEVLNNMGVPTYANVSGGFYDTFEIRTVLSLLSVIDNPLCDIPLIATLRAPFFAFSENELASIRLAKRRGAFKEAMDLRAQDRDALGEKCRAFLKTLGAWRHMAREVSADRLIEHLVTVTGFKFFVSALPGGSIRKANLRLLYETAKKFENSSFNGLFNFIRFIGRTKERSSIKGVTMLGANDNVVRIMTVHASKGLEFPVVFFADAGKRFNKRDLSNKIMLHKELGLGIECVDKNYMVRYGTPVRVAIRIKKEEELEAEEMRVLYVALTRAKEKLFIVGKRKNFDMEKEGGPFFSKERIMRANSYLDWILGAAYKNNTEVKCHSYAACTQTEPPRKDKIKPLPPGEELSRKLEFKYIAGTAPSKLSVSELRKAGEIDDGVPLYSSPEIKKPDFAVTGTVIDGARLGSLVHFVMQQIDISDTDSLESVTAQLDKMCVQNIITTTERKAIDSRKIYRFFDSDIGKRMKNADEVIREAPFTMQVKASVLSGKEDDTEQVIVQGVIDCVLKEKDNYVLIDYKTDKGKNAEQVKEKYKRQLDFYGLALEKKFFVKIYEKIIYLFEKGDIIEM